jgi:hypothetical protein
MAVKLNQREGITCGRRTNKGVEERCVLWSDDTFEWFSLKAFAQKFGV